MDEQIYKLLDIANLALYAGYYGVASSAMKEFVEELEKDKKDE